MGRAIHKTRGARVPLELLQTTVPADYAFASTTSNPTVYSPTLDVGALNVKKHVLVFSGARGGGAYNVTDVDVDAAQGDEIGDVFDFFSNNYTSAAWIAPAPAAAGGVTVDITRNAAPFNAYAYAVPFLARSGWRVAHYECVNGNSGSTASSAMTLRPGALVFALVTGAASITWGSVAFANTTLRNRGSFDSIGHAVGFDEKPNGFNGVVSASWTGSDVHNTHYIGLEPA